MTLENRLKSAKQIDIVARKKAQHNFDCLAKPLRSLGRLEELVVSLAGITGNENPIIEKKAVLVLCADNGVVVEGVTQTSQLVTTQVAENMVNGCATINSFCKVARADAIIVDVGIASDRKIEGIINRKIDFGTKNMAKERAMSYDDTLKAIEIGIQLVADLSEKGYDIIATGEMGIGNTTTSSAMLCVYTGVSVEKVAGRGAGLSSEGLIRKIEVIKQAILCNQPDVSDAIDVLSKLGGFDIAVMTGCFLGGAIYRIPIVIDGLISAVSAITASRILPLCKDYMIPSHCSKEVGGRLAMDTLEMRPYFDCDMCLGEGTGAVMMFSLIEYALSAYNKSATFRDSEIEPYQFLK